MRRVIWLVLSFFLVLPSFVSAKDASLSMIYTNALHEELPFSIFTKGEWRPDPTARFVKLHLYFDDPIMVKGLALDTCGTKQIDPNISLFFNFDQWILRSDPNLSGEIPEALYPKQAGRLLAFDGFEKDIEVRSLTFNFESNFGFKICGIYLKD